MGWDGDGDNDDDDDKINRELTWKSLDQHHWAHR